MGVDFTLLPKLPAILQGCATPKSSLTRGLLPHTLKSYNHVDPFYDFNMGLFLCAKILDFFAWILTTLLIYCIARLGWARATPKHHDQATYTFDSLKEGEFRLMTLQPGTRLDPIVFELQVIKLSLQPDYAALSYVWGDPTVTEPIFMSTGQQLAATTNLVAALRRLRHKQQPRVLWVDALCINQKDLDERAAQVIQMSKIYAWAAQVLIWLGEENENEGYRCLRIMDDVDQLLTSYSPVYHITMSAPTTKQEIEHWERIDTKLDTMNMIPLLQFLERPWFRRAWVVQELVKSREATMIWGRTSIPWQRVRKVLPMLCTQRHDLRSCCFWFTTMNILCRSAEEFQAGNLKWDLAELIWNISKFDCSDPRDKVYSILNLTRTQLPPDYRKDLSDLSKDLMRYFVQEQATLKILSLAGLSYQPKGASTPSWAPQIGCQFPSSMLFHGLYNATKVPKSLNARRKILADACISFDCDAMSLDVIHVDKVTCCTEVLNVQLDDVGKFDKNNSPEIFEDILRVAFGGVSQTRDSEDMVFRSVLVTLCGEAPVAINELANSQDKLKTLASRIPIRVGTSDGRWFVDAFDSLLGLWYCLNDHLSGRRFGVTLERRFALLPPKSKQGDDIVLISGSTVPHVVRHVEGDEYVLVGDCYVNGIMNGEAYQEIPDVHVLFDHKRVKLV